MHIPVLHTVNHGGPGSYIVDNEKHYIYVQILPHSEIAENPKMKILWQNIGFIQESMATCGPSTIASHF